MFGATVGANISYGYRTHDAKGSESLGGMTGFSSDGAWPEIKLPVAASEAAIVDAARQANAHDFILALPRKYDTKISDK